VAVTIGCVAGVGGAQATPTPDENGYVEDGYVQAGYISSGVGDFVSPSGIAWRETADPVVEPVDVRRMMDAGYMMVSSEVINTGRNQNRDAHLPGQNTADFQLIAGALFVDDVQHIPNPTRLRLQLRSLAAQPRFDRAVTVTTGWVAPANLELSAS